MKAALLSLCCSSKLWPQLPGHSKCEKGRPSPGGDHKIVLSFPFQIRMVATSHTGIFRTKLRLNKIKNFRLLLLPLFSRAPATHTYQLFLSRRPPTRLMVSPEPSDPSVCHPLGLSHRPVVSPRGSSSCFHLEGWVSLYSQSPTRAPTLAQRQLCPKAVLGAKSRAWDKPGADHVGPPDSQAKSGPRPVSCDGELRIYIDKHFPLMWWYGNGEYWLWTPSKRNAIHTHSLERIPHFSLVTRRLYSIIIII